MTTILILSMAVAGGIALVALLVHTWRKLNTGALDAVCLAAKTAVPNPSSARDWPELRIDTLLVAPGDNNEALVEATWPGQPANRATLVVHFNSTNQSNVQILRSWQLQGASIVPMPSSSSGIELRRRGTRTHVDATVLSETYRGPP
jgi:hypothetical protein